MKLHPTRNTLSSSDAIAEILRETKTIAVIGLSANPLRPSFAVSEYLQRVGYRIIPVNPNEKEILGEKCYARMEDIPESIDMVDVFRRAEHLLPLAESAIKVGAKTIWFQLGIENAAAARLAHGAGLNVVEDACLLIEHKKRRPL
jgi:predicted CoA-binding protein